MLKICKRILNNKNHKLDKNLYYELQMMMKY